MFDDESEEKQWRYGYGGVKISQFQQDFFNKTFRIQDQGDVDEIDTIQNGVKIWPNIFIMGEWPIPDNIFDYEYSKEGLDHSVRGAKIFPEIGKIKKVLDVLRCKGVRNRIKLL